MVGYVGEEPVISRIYDEQAGAMDEAYEWEGIFRTLTTTSPDEYGNPFNERLGAPYATAPAGWWMVYHFPATEKEMYTGVYRLIAPGTPLERGEAAWSAVEEEGVNVARQVILMRRFWRGGGGDLAGVIWIDPSDATRRWIGVPSSGDNDFRGVISVPAAGAEAKLIELLDGQDIHG